MRYSDLIGIFVLIDYESLRNNINKFGSGRRRLRAAAPNPSVSRDLGQRPPLVLPSCDRRADAVRILDPNHEEVRHFGVERFPVPAPAVRPVVAGNDEVCSPRHRIRSTDDVISESDSAPTGALWVRGDDEPSLDLDPGILRLVVDDYQRRLQVDCDPPHARGIVVNQVAPRHGAGIAPAPRHQGDHRAERGENEHATQFPHRSLRRSA